MALEFSVDVEFTCENSMSSAAAFAAAEPREISPLYEKYYDKRAELERLQKWVGVPADPPPKWQPRTGEHLKTQAMTELANIVRLGLMVGHAFFTKERDINVESVKTKLAIVDAFVFLGKKHRYMIERFERAAAWDQAWGLLDKMGGFEKWIEKHSSLWTGFKFMGATVTLAGLLTLAADLAPFIAMSGPHLWIPSLIAICLGGAAWIVWRHMEAKRSKEDKFNTNLYQALKQLQENLDNEADVKSLLKQLQHLKGVSTTRWEGVAPTVLNSDDRYNVGECPICLAPMLCCSDQKTLRDALLATPAVEAQHNAHCKGKHLFHYHCLDRVSPAGDGGLRAGTCPCCRSPYIRIVKLKVGRDGQGREVFDGNP